MYNLWILLHSWEDGKTRLNAEYSSKKQYLNIFHEWVTHFIYNSKIYSLVFNK